MNKKEYKTLSKVLTLLNDYLIIQEEKGNHDRDMYMKVGEASSLLSVMLLHYTWHKEDKELNNESK